MPRRSYEDAQKDRRERVLRLERSILAYNQKHRRPVLEEEMAAAFDIQLGVTWRTFQSYVKTLLGTRKILEELVEVEKDGKKKRVRAFWHVEAAPLERLQALSLPPSPALEGFAPEAPTGSEGGGG